MRREGRAYTAKPDPQGLLARSWPPTGDIERAVQEFFDRPWEPSREPEPLPAHAPQSLAG